MNASLNAQQQQGLAVIAAIAGQDVATLRPEQHLVGDLGIDSPKALQMLLQLEEELGIEIDDDAAAKMDTVGDVLAYLASIEPKE
jgi:acyl carrier protein